MFILIDRIIEIISHKWFENSINWKILHNKKILGMITEYKILTWVFVSEIQTL